MSSVWSVGKLFPRAKSENMNQQQPFFKVKNIVDIVEVNWMCIWLASYDSMIPWFYDSSTSIVIPVSAKI